MGFAVRIIVFSTATAIALDPLRRLAPAAQPRADQVFETDPPLAALPHFA